MHPDFFIVGAPKCGTTAMSVYLRAHPNIFMTYPKEPHYFARDLHYHTATDSLDDYLSLFKKANPSVHKTAGEASVWYLFSDVALENIYQFNSAAKLIVMLRNPVEMFASLHAQMLYSCYENELDPEIAWQKQTMRAAGKMIPRRCPEPKVLQYKAIVSLGQQMQKLYNFYPSSQVLPIVFDDFTQNPAYAYKRTLNFLGIEKYYAQTFTPVNERRQHRIQWLGGLLENPPNWIRLLAKKSRQHLDVSWGRIADVIRAANSEKTKFPPLSVPFQKLIVAEMENDINILSELLGRDLTCWLEIKPPSNQEVS